MGAEGEGEKVFTDCTFLREASLGEKYSTRLECLCITEAGALRGGRSALFLVEPVLFLWP